MSVVVPFDGREGGGVMSMDHRARTELVRLERRFDDIERKLTLLSDHIGVDVRALVAVDDHNRRGALVTWAEMVAAGLDPTTGEPIGGGSQ